MTIRLQDIHITKSTFCFDLAMCKSQAGGCHLLIQVCRGTGYVGVLAGPGKVVKKIRGPTVEN
eukprot:1559551-Rhodomonas_salina.1